MKKQLLLVVALCSTIALNATSIWSGNHHVTWSTTLSLDSTSFSSVKAGNQLTLTLANATDVIELKSNGQKLPGTCYTNINEKTSHTIYFTEAMADTCKKYGMEICGAAFDVTDIDLADGKNDLKEGKTIWTGYFWMDSWCTLELFKEALSVEDMSLYKAMRFYHESATNTFIINVKANWDDNGAIASLSTSTALGNAMQYNEGYVELDLTQVDPLAVINTVSSDRLMVQCNKEDGEAFNMTDIVLVPKDATPSAVEQAQTNSNVEGIYDLLGRRIDTITTSGFYIINGHKTMVNL